MKVDVYTYNRPLVQYHQPTFMARPIKVDWNGESGQKILATLAYLSSIYAASYSYAKAHPEKVDDDVMAELNSVKYANVSWNSEWLLQNSKDILEKYYKATKDPNILDKHVKLAEDAFRNNKDILRGSAPEMSYQELAGALMDEQTVNALGLLDTGVLKSAFSLDLSGFKNFCKDVSGLITLLTRTNLEALKKKINPQNTKEYRDLEEDVKKDKRQITKLLGIENNHKRKELLVQIEELKGDKENAKQIRELKKQIQDLYKNCENSEQISELMKKISEKQHLMKEILKGKLNLSPQEIINKIWTIAAISQGPHYIKDEIVIPGGYYSEALIDELNSLSESDNDDKFHISRDKLEEIFGEDMNYLYKRKNKLLNKDMKEMIDLIQPSSKTNDIAWKKVINKKLYERAELKYNDKIADILDLSNCKYLNELIVSDDAFWCYMSLLIESLAVSFLENENQTIGGVLDSLLPNIDTKKAFQKRKIDYNAWVNYDENSYIQDKVTIKAKDAQEKAVMNMVQDLVTLYYTIPEEESDEIFDVLKEMGLYVKPLGNNYAEIGIDDRGITFEELSIIMAVIKESLNYNEFWSQENDDEEIERARDHLYCHFMLQRKQEIDCAKKLKESETLDIKVKKVNMADIKYSLCLGNHSHCCTALGSQTNEWSAPSYVLHRCMNAIEVLANDEPVGNTMIYLADVNGKLSLVLDDIELQIKFQNNDKIRDMIIEYAKQICKEIGKPDIPIYAGPGMQKVDFSQYPVVNDAKMVILGKTAEGAGVYLDFDNDCHEIGNKKEKTTLYRIV